MEKPWMPWWYTWSIVTVSRLRTDMDTLLCLTWRTSKDLLDSTGNSAQYSVITLLQGEGWGKG